MNKIKTQSRLAIRAAVAMLVITAAGCEETLDGYPMMDSEQATRALVFPGVRPKEALHPELRRLMRTTETVFRDANRPDLSTARPLEKAGWRPWVDFVLDSRGGRIACDSGCTTGSEPECKPCDVGEMLEVDNNNWRLTSPGEPNPGQIVVKGDRRVSARLLVELAKVSRSKDHKLLLLLASKLTFPRIFKETKNIHIGFANAITLELQPQPGRKNVVLEVRDGETYGAFAQRVNKVIEGGSVPVLAR